MEYDYIIAGAGIAGLYTAYHINKSFPKARICILEASAYIGGRLHTISYDGIKVDGGGARFNAQQNRIVSLVHQLGLDDKKREIKGEAQYIPINPNYDSQIDNIFPTIDDFINELQNYIKTHNISDQILIKHNLLELADIYYKDKYPTIKNFLIARYSYYSELNALNALEGINLFTNEFSKKMKYFILEGGLEQLSSTIYKILKKKSNITIKTLTPLREIISSNGSYKIISPDKEYNALKIILALPQCALKKIKYLMADKRVARMINSVKSEPLYRIYARYPLNKDSKVWFHDMPKIFTNLPIKYIIPINYDKGVIMISYTDSKYANYWFKKMEEGIFEQELTRQLKLLFPDKDIPKPKWYKHCPWTMGAAYWKPGFNRKDILEKIIKPWNNKDIYICGENYSSHQAWVEGSLETSDIVLNHLHIPIGTRKNTKINKIRKTKKNLIKIGGAKTKKWPKYTLSEVGKHNKKDDAWIAIDGIVSDITKWIPKHPGGDIIMKGVGKNATKLFNSIGHDNYAKKMLKKYQIGILV
jgi:monoamine oxidase